MLGARDVVWGVLLGALAVLWVQSYPLFRAERFAKAQCAAAFEHAYKGRRMSGGDLIRPAALTGAVATDPLEPPIEFRRFDVTAEHVSWNGARTELVVRHVIGLSRLDSAENPTHEIYLKLARTPRGFAYEHFQVRGREPLPLPIAGNPFATIMRD